MQPCLADRKTLSDVFLLAAPIAARAVGSYRKNKAMSPYSLGVRRRSAKPRTQIRHQWSYASQFQKVSPVRALPMPSSSPDVLAHHQTAAHWPVQRQNIRRHSQACYVRLHIWKNLQQPSHPIAGTEDAPQPEKGLYTALHLFLLAMRQYRHAPCSIHQPARTKRQSIACILRCDDLRQHVCGQL